MSLFELVQAYSALAHRGRWRPLRISLEEDIGSLSQQVFSPEVSSLLANILADPDARRLEFGRNSVLHLPVQTAVKTGTSSDHRDAWAVGFNHRYVVGIWLGNLDQNATEGLTGSRGPALLLRSVFAHLNERGDTRPLYLSPRLTRHSVSQNRQEWFLPGTAPEAVATNDEATTPIELRQPSPGLHLARDPRVPDSEEAFEFLLSGVADEDQVEWWLNDKAIARSTGSRYLWPLQAGEHRLHATIWRDGKQLAATKPVSFSVR